MKKSIKTTIISLAMCGLMSGSAVPVFAASVPVNVTGNVTQSFIYADLYNSQFADEIAAQS